jgi:hypothetical protein
LVLAEPTRAGMAMLLTSFTSLNGSMPFCRSAASRKRSGVLPGRSARICLPLSCCQSNLSTFSRPISMKPSVTVSPQKMGILVGESPFCT